MAGVCAFAFAAGVGAGHAVGGRRDGRLGGGRARVRRVPKAASAAAASLGGDWGGGSLGPQPLGSGGAQARGQGGGAGERRRKQQGRVKQVRHVQQGQVPQQWEEEAHTCPFPGLQRILLDKRKNLLHQFCSKLL